MIGSVISYNKYILFGSIIIAAVIGIFTNARDLFCLGLHCNTMGCVQQSEMFPTKTNK